MPNMGNIWSSNIRNSRLIMIMVPLLLTILSLLMIPVGKAGADPLVQVDGPMGVLEIRQHPELFRAITTPPVPWKGERETQPLTAGGRRHQEPPAAQQDFRNVDSRQPYPPVGP